MIWALLHCIRHAINMLTLGSSVGLGDSSSCVMACRHAVSSHAGGGGISSSFKEGVPNDGANVGTRTGSNINESDFDRSMSAVEPSSAALAAAQVLLCWTFVLKPTVLKPADCCRQAHLQHATTRQPRPSPCISAADTCMVLSAIMPQCFSTASCISATRWFGGALSGAHAAAFRGLWQRQHNWWRWQTDSGADQPWQDILPVASSRRHHWWRRGSHFRADQVKTCAKDIAGGHSAGQAADKHH